MYALKGFNLECALAAKQAMKTDDETFIHRMRLMEFWGLYDPEPCGAVLFEGYQNQIIHVASLRPAGLTIKRIVKEALKTRDIIFAPIFEENKHTAHLAELLGFKKGIVASGVNVYWRTSK